MFIERLAVKGFRSLADVVWEPGRLNVLIGPNGGGKTNLLKVVRLLKASAVGQLGKFVQREGGMQAMVWDGSAKGISIECHNMYAGDPWRYSLDLAGFGATSVVRREQLLAAESWSFERNVVERKSSAATIIGDDGEGKTIPPKDVKPHETILSLVGAASESVLVYDFAGSLSNSVIYGIVDLSASMDPKVVAFDESIDDDGENFIPALHNAYSNRDFERDMNLAMSAAFGSDFEKVVFPPAADQRVQMRVRWKSLKNDPSDVSDGTLRFMFLVTVLANPKRPEFIAIEEPETGLHPRMLPIIADLAADAAQHSQIVFTTHSPAFLDAIGKHNPTVTIVETDEGKTRLKNVSNEELSYWLKQFTLGEVYQTGQLEDVF